MKRHLLSHLQSLGARPKKSLSQNFLIDESIVDKILQTASVEKEETILEIGPGAGALTEALLKKGAHVIAIEKDKKLASALNHHENLQVICGDILEVDLEQILKNRPQVKVVANLPYHITTPVITKLVSLHPSISTCTVMIQEEVARRWTADPHTRAYGSLTVFLRFFSNLSYAFKVSRNCFHPVPNVDSAVVHLTLHPPQVEIDQEAFFSFVRSAFSKKRKMLRRSLRDSYPIVEALEKLDLSENARPEELTLEQWIALYKSL